MGVAGFLNSLCRRRRNPVENSMPFAESDSATPIRLSGFGEVAAGWWLFPASVSQVDECKAGCRHHQLALALWNLIPGFGLIVGCGITQSMGKGLTIDVEKLGQFFCIYFVDRHKFPPFRDSKSCVSVRLLLG